MPEHDSEAVADKRWRVRLLAMDGLLVLLFGWLIFVFLSDGDEPSVEAAGDAKTAAEDTAVDSTADGAAPVPGADGSTKE